MTAADQDPTRLSAYLIGEKRGCHDLVAAHSADEALRYLYACCGYGPDDAGPDDVHALSEAECRAMHMLDDNGNPGGTVWDALLECGDRPDLIGGTEW